MKKILIRFMSIFMLLLIAITIMNYIKKCNYLKWNQNVLQNRSYSNLIFPICQRKQHISQIAISLNHGVVNYELDELPLNHLFKGICENDLSPMVYNNDILYLCQNHLIQIYSINQNKILWEKSFTKILGTTLPIYRNAILSFYILEYDKSLNSCIVSKITYTDNKINQEFFARIILEESQTTTRTNSEIFYFSVNDSKIFIPICDNKKSYIFEYALDGSFIKSYGEGYEIIPNKFDTENIYYLKECDFITKNNQCISNSYKLMKNENEIIKIDKPVIFGYFVKSDNIYLQTYDTCKIERFDLINGPWAPIEEAYLIDINSKSWIPFYIKEPWREGCFFIRSKIRNETCLLIPSI